MLISCIVASSEDNAIGKGGGMPWHLPADLRYFRQITMGKPVIMGRNTFYSLKKPLKGRLNVIISSTLSAPPAEGVLLFASLQDALRQLADTGNYEEVMIIGGGQLYRAAMPYITQIYLTRVHSRFPDADVFFPEIDSKRFKQIAATPHEADAENPYAYTYYVYALYPDTLSCCGR
ncbi:MAG: dihydrofolate reductase [Chitinophagia bacterium]|nr:dihydrofolate reductase [Chitinophagia bacterium]